MCLVGSLNLYCFPFLFCLYLFSLLSLTYSLSDNYFCNVRLIKWIYLGEHTFQFFYDNMASKQGCGMASSIFSYSLPSPSFSIPPPLYLLLLLPSFQDCLETCSNNRPFAVHKMLSELLIGFRISVCQTCENIDLFWRLHTCLMCFDVSLTSWRLMNAMQCVLWLMFVVCLQCQLLKDWN